MKKEINAIKLDWWNKLGEDNQNWLIELLYDIDLKDFVNMDPDGNIISRID